MNGNGSCSRGARYRWKTVNRKYENFTDLGRYVIDCDRHLHFDYERARRYVNERCDFGSRYCTALSTRARNGDVLIGRNLDLTVSQLPCYITHVRHGRLDTLNFTYDEMGHSNLRYDMLLAQGYLDEEYYNALPMIATDSMNSAGLYIECNMRDYEEQFFCSGTNPRCANRICMVSIPFAVAANCATVPEALRYLRTQVNIFTPVDHTVGSGWNLSCIIGDALGNYGLIEIANNEIRYLPQQHGQGNYYIYPAYNCISRGQSGYGRLQFGLERIDRVQTEQQMAELMEDVMWRNEILTVPYAYRDCAGHLHFCADEEHRTEGLDWRSDNVRRIPVNASGHYVDVDAQTPEARQVREYKIGYEHYMAGARDRRSCEDYERYREYLSRSDLTWVQTDAHFEELQRGLIKYYTENGTFEKLLRYYAGDEKPLRDDGLIFTTSLSFSVNCTRKHLTVKFWENPTTVMEWQW